MLLSDRVREEYGRLLTESHQQEADLKEVLRLGGRRRVIRTVALTIAGLGASVGLAFALSATIAALRQPTATFARQPGPLLGSSRVPFTQVTLEQAQARAPYHILRPHLKGAKVIRVDYSDQTAPGGARVFSVDLTLEVSGRRIHSWMTNYPLAEWDIDQRGFRGIEVIAGEGWRRQDLRDPGLATVTIQLSRRITSSFWIEVDGPVADRFLRSIVASLS